MVTVGRIQAHLLDRFAQLFKKCTIKYCLTKRLQLKYSNFGKPKLVFTPARKRSAMIFCGDFDIAIKLERDGTHIIVYIDESYYHVNHRSSQGWWSDGNKSVHGRGRSDLTILIHTRWFPQWCS